MNVRLFSALYLQPFFSLLLSGCYSAHCQRRVVSRSSTHTLHSETSKSYKMKSGKFTFGNRWSVLVVALLTFDSIQLISRLGFFPSFLLLAPLCCFALLWVLSPPALWFISVQLTLLLFFSLDFSFFYVQVLFFFQCSTTHSFAFLRCELRIFLHVEQRWDSSTAIQKERRMAKAKSSQPQRKSRKLQHEKPI